MTYSNKYDLRLYDSVVKDQGKYGSCVQNALTSSMESLMNQAGHSIPLLSRMQNYYDTREAQGTVNEDSGSINVLSVYEAMTKGIAPESAWSYTQDHLYAKPTQNVYDLAENTQVYSYKPIASYWDVETIRDNVLEYLSQGKTILTAFYVRSYFWSQSGPLQYQDSDGKGIKLTAHAVEIVGYDANLNGGSYIVKNSWGTNWGDHGYGSIKWTQFDKNNDSDLISMQVVTGMKVNGEVYDFNYSADKETIAEQYATILGRAADIEGMHWYLETHPEMITSEWQLADNLISSVEGQSIYGHMNNEQFVRQVYHNVLGREGDSTGVAYWTGRLDDGITRGTLFAGFLDSLELPNAEGHKLLENKTDLSMYISIAKWYDGNESVAVRNEMARVTADDTALEIIKLGIPHDWSVM